MSRLLQNLDQVLERLKGYETVFEEIPLGIILVKGGLLSVSSRAFDSWLEYPRHSLRGRPLRSMIYGPDWPSTESLYSRIRTGDYILTEPFSNRYSTRTGRLARLSWLPMGMPAKDDSVVGVCELVEYI